MTAPPDRHSDHTHEGNAFSMGHLSSFIVSIPGKGKAAGTDLQIRVRFSNHVYSERPRHHTHPHDFLDHLGSKRCFDLVRYQASLALPGTLRRVVQTNELVRKSKSYGGSENLIFFTDFNNLPWIVVVCFYPWEDDAGVDLHVLSTHQKQDHGRHKLERIVASARTCLFSGDRYPTA